MKIHSTQRVLCICRNGQVRSIATRHLLATIFGFKKVICAGWDMNDEKTLQELYKWSDIIVVVGRPSEWNLNTPSHKTIHLEIGQDIYGHYLHPRLLELLMSKLPSIVEPKPIEEEKLSNRQQVARDMINWAKAGSQVELGGD